MKRILGFFFIFGFFFAFPSRKLHAQKPFEGTISWSMSMPMGGDDEKHSMTFNMKGHKFEIEMDMGAFGVIKTYGDDSTKKGYMVMESTKKGYLIDKSDSAEAGKFSSQFDTVDLKPTGHTAMIAGHPAEEYLLSGMKINGTNADMSIWAASDFPKEIKDAMNHGLRTNSDQSPQEWKAMKQLEERGLVAVRIVAKMGGEEAMSIEFDKCEVKHLDDALFVPPADIKYSPMPKMGTGGMD